MFIRHFSKGNNFCDFLFAFQDNSGRSKDAASLRVDPIEKAGKNRTCRDASPESVAHYL